MGLCLSCLRSSDPNDDELNENSSLLRNQHNLYSSDYLQEAELLKQQQRQQELNSIVNELSDNLIDVSTFLNNEQHIRTGSGGEVGTPINSENNGSAINGDIQTSYSYSNNLHPQTEEASASQHNADDSESKIFPKQYNQNQRLAVSKSVTELNSAIKDSCKISLNEPLYLVL